MLPVNNGIAYVANSRDSLQLVDVNNPLAPVLLKSYNTTRQPLRVVVQNSIAYVSGYYGLQLINVNNPLAPSMFGNYSSVGGYWAITVRNGVAYVVSISGVNGVALELIDVNNPLAPSLLGIYNTPVATLGSFGVQNGIAYVTTGASLRLINVSNPAALILLGNFNVPANGVAIQNGMAYVAGNFDLQIIDLRVTRLIGMVPFNATGNYSLKIHATNVNEEWISTGLQLHIIAPTPTVTPSPTPTPVPAIASSTTLASAPTLSSAPTPSPTPTSINMPPVLQNNTLAINQGRVVTLTPQLLNATDDRTLFSDVRFIVSQISNGYFQNSNSPGSFIYSFTQQQVQSGEIQFVHDGSTNPPSYQVYVNDGSLNSFPQWAAIMFEGNAVPVLVTNQLSINTGETVVFTNTNLQANDADISNTNNLVFTLTSIQYGYFDNSNNPGVPITSFTQGDINAGNIRFTHDGSTNYPSYYVSASDGIASSAPSLVNIRFNNNTVPIVLNNQLTVTPGTVVTLNIANIGGLDLDNSNTNLQFTVTDITGGQFELTNNPGVSITQFTQQDIIDGNVNFVADETSCDNPDTSPSYSLQVSTGSLSSLVSVADINYQQTTTTQGCVVTTTQTDNTNLYIGLGVAGGVAAVAVGVGLALKFGVFANKKRQVEKIIQMAEIPEEPRLVKTKG